MEGYRPTTYGDGFADVYDQWYGDITPPADTATFVAARARGLVIELGSGTGRLAGPLAARGVPVIGLDASEAMLRQSKVRARTVPVVAADMAEPPFRPGVASVVFVAFNTLFNLPSPALQRQALRHAAGLLAPGGSVIIEAFVPEGPTLDDASPRDHVDVVRLDADRVVLRVSRTDPNARTVSGHHIELRDNAPVRLRPWHLHYDDPAGLDRNAATAGLTCVERYQDWASTPFEDSSPTHVSVYRRGE